jgi:hypothetical protein
VLVFLTEFYYMLVEPRICLYGYTVWNFSFMYIYAFVLLDTTGISHFVYCSDTLFMAF